MKKSVLLILLATIIVSCQPNNPTPNPPPATPSSGIYGDWYWYKTDIVNYDENSVEVYRTSMNYPTQNVHTYNADGFIYAQGSTTKLGVHTGSILVEYYNQQGKQFHITELTATTMVMKEYPNGCDCSGVLEYFFEKL